MTAGLTLRLWDAAAGSFEAICGGPQAGLRVLPSPHTVTAALQGSSGKELSVESPHRLKPTDESLPSLPTSSP